MRIKPYDCVELQDINFSIVGDVEYNSWMIHLFSQGMVHDGAFEV